MSGWLHWLFSLFRRDDEYCHGPAHVPHLRRQQARRRLETLIEETKLELRGARWEDL